MSATLPNFSLVATIVPAITLLSNLKAILEAVPCSAHSGLACLLSHVLHKLLTAAADLSGTVRKPLPTLRNSQMHTSPLAPAVPGLGSKQVGAHACKHSLPCRKLLGRRQVGL